MRRYSVPDMSCGHCRAKIEESLLEADGGAGFDFDMDKREVAVDSVLAPAEVIDAIRAAGYEATETG